MCRSIKTLRNFEDPPAEEEVQASALQFVRKISGYRRPSKLNEEAFEGAVQEISEASARLLATLRPAGKISGAGNVPPGKELSLSASERQNV
jgi:hypothetical protein